MSPVRFYSFLGFWPWNKVESCLTFTSPARFRSPWKELPTFWPSSIIIWKTRQKPLKTYWWELEITENKGGTILQPFRAHISLLVSVHCFICLIDRHTLVTGRFARSGGGQEIGFRRSDFYFWPLGSSTVRLRVTYFISVFSCMKQEHSPSHFPSSHAIQRTSAGQSRERY